MKNLVVNFFVVFGFILFSNIACGQVTFSPFTNFPILGTLANHLTTGDFNNDGKKDVAVATSSYTTDSGLNTNYKVMVYLQDKNNSLILSDSYTYGHATDGVGAIGAGDVNNDGLCDIVIAVEAEIGIFYQNVNGKFNSPVYTYCGAIPDALKIGDINDDGINDIIITLRRQSNIAAFYGDSMGKLAYPVWYFSGASLYGDIEIARLGDDNFNSVIKMYGQGGLYSKGRLSFTVYHFNKDRSLNTETNLDLISNSVNNMPVSIVMGNVTSDKRNELIYSVNGMINVWGASPEISFDLQTPYNSGALAAGDLNSDGIDEIVMISNNFVQVIVNKVIYKFSTNSPDINSPDGIAITDVNSDGKLDIVSCNGNTGLTIMLNTTIITGTNQINDTELNVFPNPCKNIVNINNTNGKDILTIYDSTSRVIKKIKTDYDKTVVSMEGFYPGIYFVNISGKTFKVVKN